MTAHICQAVLGRSDYQLGNSKIFLKDAHDLFLEQERDRVLTKKIIIIQKSIKGWVYRRRYIILNYLMSFDTYNHIIILDIY